jgi:hypothetical protein
MNAWHCPTPKPLPAAGMMHLAARSDYSERRDRDGTIPLGNRQAEPSCISHGLAHQPGRLAPVTKPATFSLQYLSPNSRNPDTSSRALPIRLP